MITRIFGSKIEKIYSVNKNTEAITDEKGFVIGERFKAKPELHCATETVGYEEILNYEGRPEYDDFLVGFSRTLHISENERVKIEDVKFRADLAEFHVYTYKVVEETENFKESSIEEYNEAVKAFNKAMIESNDTLLAYCKLHNLDVENTDCYELLKVVYPDETPTINKGKIEILPKNTVYTLDSSVYSLRDSFDQIRGNCVAGN